MNKTTAILLAAGKSERIGNIIAKPFLQLGGKAVYRYSLDVFLSHPQIDFIILVVPKHLLDVEKAKHKTGKLMVVAGGKSRFESVKNALDHLDETFKNILIHDAARPFISKDLIDNCLESLSQNKAVSCAIESTDTLVSANVNCIAESYPDRNKIMQIQTPQAFKTEELKRAYSMAIKDSKFNFTDDSSLIHYYDITPVLLVPGTVENIKITHSTDLLLAELILNGLKRGIGE